MISIVLFRSTVIVFCDLAAVTAGAWILWNSSATSVMSGPVEDKVLFVLLVALLMCIRHTVSRRTDSMQVKTHVARITLVTDLFLVAASLIAWQATGVYYLGWLTTFALMFFIIGTGFQLLVDVVTSRNRSVTTREGARRSQRKVTFATELIRIAGVAGALIGFAYVSLVHGWDIGFINPLVMILAVAIGMSVIPTVLSPTGVLTQSSLADDLNFSSRDQETPVAVAAPGPIRSEPGTARSHGIVSTS